MQAGCEGEVVRREVSARAVRNGVCSARCGVRCSARRLELSRRTTVAARLSPAASDVQPSTVEVAASAPAARTSTTHGLPPSTSLSPPASASHQLCSTHLPAHLTCCVITHSSLAHSPTTSSPPPPPPPPPSSAASSSRIPKRLPCPASSRRSGLPCASHGVTLSSMRSPASSCNASPATAAWAASPGTSLRGPPPVHLAPRRR